MSTPTEAPPFLQRKLSLKELSKQGFYFCLVCDRVRDVEEAAGYVRCVSCQSFQVSWNPPCWSQTANPK